PPLLLPPPPGPYNVGCVDLQIPHPAPLKSKFSAPAHLSLRLLYPTDAPAGSLAYQPLGGKICDRFMAFGAPAPLKPAGFLLHYWRLITLPFAENAAPAAGLGSMPVTVYSHGLGGSPSLYSSPAGNLASSGSLVVLVEHLDGSTPLSQLADGSLLEHYSPIYELRKDGDREWDTPAYVGERREQIEVRIKEMEAALGFVRRLQKGGVRELPEGVTFKGRLDLKEGAHLVGHSYGGATILGTAGRAKEGVVRSVAAHDPAVDWVPDDVRYNLLKESGETEGWRLRGCGGYKDERKLERGGESKGLDGVPLLFIYCDDWQKTDFGHWFATLKKIEEGSVGAEGSRGMVLDSMQHFEFSDNCCIMPLWLAKGLKFSGGKPEQKIREVFVETLAFQKRC
ncbi:hypothetical protein TeGR_g12993, partial [Tetraparma gracilis]